MIYSNLFAVCCAAFCIESVRGSPGDPWGDDQGSAEVLRGGACALPPRYPSHLRGPADGPEIVSFVAGFVSLLRLVLCFACPPPKTKKSNKNTVAGGTLRPLGLSPQTDGCRRSRVGSGHRSVRPPPSSQQEDGSRAMCMEALCDAYGAHAAGIISVRRRLSAEVNEMMEATQDLGMWRAIPGGSQFWELWDSPDFDRQKIRRGRGKSSRSVFEPIPVDVGDVSPLGTPVGPFGSMWIGLVAPPSIVWRCWPMWGTIRGRSHRQTSLPCEVSLAAVSAFGGDSASVGSGGGGTSLSSILPRKLLGMGSMFEPAVLLPSSWSSESSAVAKAGVGRPSRPLSSPAGAFQAPGGFDPPIHDERAALHSDRAHLVVRDGCACERCRPSSGEIAWCVGEIEQFRIMLAKQVAILAKFGQCWPNLSRLNACQMSG